MQGVIHSKAAVLVAAHHFTQVHDEATEHIYIAHDELELLAANARRFDQIALIADLAVLLVRSSEEVGAVENDAALVARLHLIHKSSIDANGLDDASAFAHLILGVEIV